MKCAAELITMKNEAIEAHTAAVNAKYEEMTKNAITLCETTINDVFVKKAKNRELLKAKYWIEIYRDELDHEFFHFSSRRSPNSDITKTCYASRPFIDYLHKFCFEVVASEESKYGDRELTIYIPKEDNNRTCGV